MMLKSEHFTSYAFDHFENPKIYIFFLLFAFDLDL